LSAAFAPVVSCEHGGHRVPARYRTLFAGSKAILESHRGWDPGALELARAIAARLSGPLHVALVTRLLVDLNRSLGHPRHFSEISARLERAERGRVIVEHWTPHRACVEEDIASLVRARRSVLHLSVHTFTPVLDGVGRNADIGLLYDSRRTREKAFCACWRAELRAARPELRVRLNYPYRGVADGFTTYLRRRFSAASYLGIELEVNQRLVLDERRGFRELSRAIASTVAAATGASVRA